MIANLMLWLKDALQWLTVWYLDRLEVWGYPLVALLMAIESTVVPIPSEVIVPPAAHLAATKGGMTYWGIVVAGALGSWAGAAIMYWASRWAGRPLIMKYGKYVRITPEKIEGAERWAASFGAAGIFIARLLPVVRHLIGIPAGIVRMNFWTYSLFTLLGSALWCAVLCWIGVTMGADLQQTKDFGKTLGKWTLGIVGALGLLYYFFVHRPMKAGKPPAA